MSSRRVIWVTRIPGLGNEDDDPHCVIQYTADDKGENVDFDRIFEVVGDHRYPIPVIEES